jgi:hypothetical protein
MTMKLKNLLFVLGIAGSATASANTYLLGDLTASILPPTVITHAPGSFEDLFFFNLSVASIGSATVADLPITGPSGSLFDIVGGSFSTFLYQDYGTVGSVDVADSGFILGTGNYVYSSGPLAVGNYYIKIVGTAVGSAGGTYMTQATALPVPEADTSAMMMAGLGLMGVIARRRKQNATAR